MKAKNLFSGIALIAAVALGLSSFFLTTTISANMLILVAQFLVYSLTMAGLGEIACKIIELLKK